MTAFLRVVMVLVLAGTLYYLYKITRRPPPPPPPPPPILQAPPQPAFSDEEFKKIHAAVNDADPQVRWAAVQLLYHAHDSRITPILENMLSYDADPSLRQSALALLRQASRPQAIKNLLTALKDPDLTIRLSALGGLSEIGDVNSAPKVAELLNDPEPRVRLQALTTLNQLQEKKRATYQALTETLKAQYEKTVSQSQSDY